MTKNIELWNDCFEGMSMGEYLSKTNEQLEDIFKGWLQEKALLCKKTSDIKCSYEDLKTHLEKILVAIDAISDRNMRRHIDAEITIIFRKMKGVLGTKEIEKESLAYYAMIGEEDNE